MATETTRRLVNQGGTLMLSLPKGWIRYYRLKAGDRVTLYEDGIIQIRPPAEAGLPSAEASGKGRA